jgi:phosphoribosylformimino-5-aminoimidazole carboxamide ribotide isomerase
MRLIPVIDILNHVVVRGVAGQRDQYRPIDSALTSSIEPMAVALAIRERFGFDELYVADLDAITQGRPATALYQSLKELGFRLWIDAGVSNAAAARELADLDLEQVIVGLESCPSLGVLREILATVPAEQVTFSLDLKNSVPLAGPFWGKSPRDIVHAVVEAGIRNLIILDLAAVGVGQGVPTVDLCQFARQVGGTSLSIITGGGVRHAGDLEELQQAGVDAVLIASALHTHDSWLLRSN